MPPRYVYWTILIDNKPTAFRAQDRADLLPTLTQLRRTNQDVVMKYFAHGRVWDSQEQAREAGRPAAAREKRGRDWRPGGQHADPRARFDKNTSDKPRRDREAPSLSRNKSADSKAAPTDRRPPQPHGDRPWRKDQSRSAQGSRPWQDKPGATSGRQPWVRKPAGEHRPWQNKPSAPSGTRPWQDKPRASSGERRPWRNKPRASGAPKIGARKPKPPEHE
jgi:hypothetical protein